MSMLKRILDKFDFISSNNKYKEEIVKIESFLRDEQVQLFNSKYEEFLNQSNLQKKFTYWGINFENKKVASVKFYVHLYNIPSQDEVLQFIPTLEDFNRHIGHYDQNIHIRINNAGIAFELKYKLEEAEPHTGFFFMVNDESDNYFPSVLPEELKKICSCKGINYEYLNTKKIFKRYFYFNNAECGNFFNKEFHLDDLNNFDTIEYAESKDLSKINIYGTGNYLSNFAPRERKIIQYFNQKYNLKNLGYGMYFNKDIRSIYFFDTASGNNNEFDTLNKMMHEIHRDYQK